MPACLAGSRGFESRTRRQFVYIHLHTSLAQWMRAPAYEAGGHTFESCTRCHFSLDVAKWSKASACKADGDSPHPFALGGDADQDVACDGPKAEGSAPSNRVVESISFSVWRSW